MSYPVGLIRAMTDIVGESDNDIGGMFLTRTTSAVDTGLALTPVYTWNGTTTVTTADTSDVVAGDWIRLDVDGQYFEIDTITPNVSVELLNPNSLLIPSGITVTSKSIVSIPVETTFGWSDSGDIAIGGVVYRYTSKTDISFEGVTHLINGFFVPGILIFHQIESPVLDLNADRSAIDKARRALFVETAEGFDLNVVGSNVGVNRSPYLGSDEIYRLLIQNTAYSPKGTIYAMELALDALVGVGNYEIYEDLILHHNKVFIRLLGSAALTDVSVGKAYLSGPEVELATSDVTVPIDESIVTLGTVRSVSWLDENHLTDTRTVKPSTDTVYEYPGDPGYTVWAFTGTNEATQVLIDTADGGNIEFPLVGQAYYRHKGRVRPESRASVAMHFKADIGVTMVVVPQIGLKIHDYQKAIELGIAHVDANTIQVGFATGSAFINSPVNLNKGQYYDLEIKKDGIKPVKFFVDGVLTETTDWGDFPDLGFNPFKSGMFFGIFSTITIAAYIHIKSVRYYAHTPTDYFAAREALGDLTGSPDQLDTNIVGLFSAGDVGKRAITQNSLITNAQGGNNNGSWVIDTVVDDERVILTSEVLDGAFVESANPTRVTLPIDTGLLQYPDDLGKIIEISGSASGNDGSWVIGAMIEIGTGVDLDSYETILPTKTNIVELLTANFVTEPALSWQLIPNFTTEANADWVVSDMGTVAGSVITLAQVLPIASARASRVLEIIYSQVLSSQILKNLESVNEVIATVPSVAWAYYPLYLTDPLGYAKLYLDDITAAGVIAEFQIV